MSVSAFILIELKTSSKKPGSQSTEEVQLAKELEAGKWSIGRRILYALGE